MKPCLLCPEDGQGIAFPKAFFLCGGVTAKPGICAERNLAGHLVKKGYLQSRMPLGEPTKEQLCPDQCQAEPNAFLEEAKCSLSDAN